MDQKHMRSVISEKTESPDSPNPFPKKPMNLDMGADSEYLRLSNSPLPPPSPSKGPILISSYRNTLRYKSPQGKNSQRLAMYQHLSP